MVLFANAPRLHREAMAEALSARGREAGVSLPEGWSLADSLGQLHPTVLVCSGSHQEAQRLSRDVAVAHLGGGGSVLTTYISGAMRTQRSVRSFDAIAEAVETLAGEAGPRDRSSVVEV